jgi:Xaa-Pro dipeptidase
MVARIPLSELTDRMNRFRARMDAEHPPWELAALFGRVNQYYFTGTMQDGVLLVPRDGEAVFCVRRSFERACDESLFPRIRPMKSFRDAVPAVPNAAARQIIHLETELVPLALVQRFRKHFACRDLASLDAQVARLRAVKSPYELAIMERCGAIHRRVMEDSVPGMLRA